MKAYTFLALCFLLTPKWATAQSVLHIGDSLSVGPFGDSLFECLAKSKKFTQLRSEASCGSRPAHWSASNPNWRSTCGYASRTWNSNSKSIKKSESTLGTATIPQLSAGLNMDENSWTVIQLGTNNFKSLIKDPQNSEAATTALRNEVQKVLAQKPKGQCLWVLPPAAASKLKKPDGKSDYSHVTPTAVQEHLNRVIREEAQKAGCLVHDSRLDIPDFNVFMDDGYHFYSSARKIRVDHKDVQIPSGLAAAKKWGQSVCATIQTGRPPVPEQKQSLLKEEAPLPKVDSDNIEHRI